MTDFTLRESCFFVVTAVTIGAWLVDHAWLKDRVNKAEMGR